MFDGRHQKLRQAANILHARSTFYTLAIRGLPAIGAILLMTLSPACSVQAGSVPGGAQLLCSVNGSTVLSPSTSEAAVCDIFKKRIDQALAQPSRLVTTGSLASQERWLKLDIRLSKGRSAAAVLVQNEGGRVVAHPEIVVDVMDKPLGVNELELLATEVAKLIAED